MAQPSNRAKCFKTGIKLIFTSIFLSCALQTAIRASGPPLRAAPQAAGQNNQREMRAQSPIKYESTVPGVVEAKIFTAAARRGLTVEVRDFILGPGKSAADLRLTGIGVMELKSGEIETTINGQTTRRKPGDYWVVAVGQPWSIKNLAGQAVIHTFIFFKK